MCSFCDCRSHPTIAQLSTEHDVMLDLLRDLRGLATDPAAAWRSIDRILDELSSMLGPHGALEETVLFPVLQSIDVADDYIERFTHDHSGLEAILAKVRFDATHKTTEKPWGTNVEPAQLIALVDALETHIHEEETDTFPAAQQLLAPADWDEVERRRTAARV